jgi:hypothetical protein
MGSHFVTLSHHIKYTYGLINLNEWFMLTLSSCLTVVGILFTVIRIELTFLLYQWLYRLVEGVVIYCSGL